MKRLKKETRCNTQSNLGMSNISKCEKHNEDKTNFSIGYFESMTMFK